MKRFLASAFSILVMSLSLPGTAHAQIETYSFDKVHTQILFFVNHLGFSHSQGEFLDFDGGFTFDRGEPEKSNVEVTIRTDSIDMDDEKWDAHMKNADFFNVEQYPTMHFKSTAITLTGKDTADITGDLTILGVTKPVTLSTKLNKVGPHPFGSKYMAGLSASAHIKRSDFGMNYGLPMIGDDVEIRIEVEAVRDDSAAQGVENP